MAKSTKIKNGVEVPVTKEGNEIIKLTTRAEAVVTKKGAEIKFNKWKEGQIISAHPVLIEYFESKGLVTTKATKKEEK
jgi:hypothetical protein